MRHMYVHAIDGSLRQKLRQHENDGLHFTNQIYLMTVCL